ncbi:hypothetical protein FUSO7_10810 [Fusobacterium necrophorum BFTR-2]|nr:hypothetical protein [Fusobacterium necrophorum]KDE70287.1 hypothetical protein FUSO7_10810 [Fusobacterium necrophorum BFTR-2]
MVKNKTEKFDYIEKITKEFIKSFFCQEYNFGKEELDLAVKLLKNEIEYKLNFNSKKHFESW